MKGIALGFKMKDSLTTKAEQKALVLCPVLCILVCYELVKTPIYKMDIRNSAYCLQG